MKTSLSQTFIKTGLIAGFSFGIAVAPVPRGVAAQNDNTTEKLKTSGAVSNRGLAVDGQKSCMQVPDSSSFHAISNAITLEARCLANSFYPFRGSVNSILRKNIKAGAENFFLRIRNMDGPRLVEVGLGSQLGVLQAPSEIQTNQWYHLAGTYDGVTVTVYVNGVKIKSEPISGNLTIDSSDLVIGKGDPEFSSGEYFHGVLDEVRVWNVARSPEEIQAAMNKPLTGKEKGLVAYWNFDDGTAKDLSGHANHGRLEGNARTMEVPRADISPAKPQTGAASQAVTEGLTVEKRVEVLENLWRNLSEIYPALE
jgi:hypothetical protein